MINADLNKQNIDSIKNDENYLFSYFKTQNERSILFLLEKFGRLENSSSRDPLIFLLNHKNENIRAASLKNLAKLSDLSLLDFFVNIAHNDRSTIVRREAVSAIGRLKNNKIIPFLLKLLKDNDPKVIMQAIRGLLKFTHIEAVKNSLLKLEAHPNELIKEVIQKEFLPKESNIDKDPTAFPDYLKNVVVFGDVLETLKNVDDESIHLTFTSPPYYNARDYSIYQSYQEYLDFLETVFKEIHRITKEGRYFIINTSPIIIPRISRAHSSKRYPIPFDIHPLLVKMGWEFIDDIVWVKPEASVKDRNSSFRQHRKPLAYKPNSLTEMVMVYRKKTDKLLDWNIKQYNWDIIKKSKVTEDFEKNNVWNIDPTFDKIHTAVFPLELCNRIIKFYSMVGDLVFDPFAGSGTFAKSAMLLARNFFLTENNLRYFNRIKEILGFKENQDDIFSKSDLKFITLREFIESTKNIEANNYSIVSEASVKYKKKKNDTNKNRNRKHNPKTPERKRLSN